MSSSEAGESPPFRVPAELRPGAYANAFQIWHTVSEFTLDFAVLDSADPDEIGEAEAETSCLVVARVRLPAILLFDLLRLLSDNLNDYERAWGEIPRPRNAGESEER